MTIEVLAYSPFDMTRFSSFVIEGKPLAQGGFEIDGRGRMKTGVLRWLHGRQVPEAHFFTTPPQSPPAPSINLFMALVEKPEPPDREVPWMRFIVGLEEQINPDGVIGQINNFMPIGEVLTAVRQDDVLNQAFRDGRANVLEVLRQIRENPGRLSVMETQLLRTLRNERGTNPQAVFAEVLDKFGIAL